MYQSANLFSGFKSRHQSKHSANDRRLWPAVIETLEPRRLLSANVTSYHDGLSLEYERMLAKAETPHIRLFIILALSTAGRMTAILELTWDRVDFERELMGRRYTTGMRGAGHGDEGGYEVVFCGGTFLPRPFLSKDEC